MRDFSWEIQSALNSLHEDHFDQTLAQCQAILAESPEHAQALHLLGLAEVRLGQTEQAQAHLEQALQLNPENAGFHYNYGLVLEQAGECELCRCAPMEPGIPAGSSAAGWAFAADGSDRRISGRLHGPAGSLAGPRRRPDSAGGTGCPSRGFELLPR
ncbi:MAG: hypothetical protein CVV27_04680 [Candidatus Melainabacteria bacterium HGW-Melainabacteria-1]|nr:MAG: hypothetical protein CVV27_04680 [Candidatus Melainabacteria bacterium HGW-Melainabacteria-1]